MLYSTLLLFLVFADDCEFFQCSDKSRTVPAKFVNDDFCDCPDGSDEFLTSACALSKFSCPDKIIFSSWVQDGVCDCCDGSDEEPGLCADKCTNLHKARKEKQIQHFSQWQRGLKYKIEASIQGKNRVKGFDNEAKDYEKRLNAVNEKLLALKTVKNSAQQLELYNDEAEKLLEKAENERKELEGNLNNINRLKSLDFGKYYEFGSLINKKIVAEIGKYTYTIFFFDKVIQKEGNSNYSLGNWSGFDQNYTSMKFTGGTGCPNKISRSVTIILSCADSLILSDFKEVSMCTYEVSLSLPAACKQTYSALEFDQRKHK